MNIHFIAGTRVPTPRGHKVSKEGTQPPRTRPGATYPGGKSLRKRLGRLAARKANYEASKGLEAYTRPGSMR